ncbi:shikimate dehydrogenase [Candidatus Sumerlaeota bacterium]|nr:shikimate dehydrogenase [Candidatus Sumerlaeota bacterium]
MSTKVYPKADRPTIYFIGVTTSKSSIMKVFPEWARFLGLSNARIRGIDFRQHDEPSKYRKAVEFIKHDELSLGALVTTHKIDLLKASRDLFDELDTYARLMGEISCISKREGKLIGHAKDPITSGLALESFLPENYWTETGAEVFVMGAGGSSIAITCYLMKKEHGANRPSKIIVSNRSEPRLKEIQRIHKMLNADIPCEYYHTPKPELNDKIMQKLKPYSLIINATGLGKDAPGSPITDAGVFPENGKVWDFNYRGDLVFLDQARAQQKQKNLHIEDGWIYFIYGWLHVIAEVFHIDIPTYGPVFDKLTKIAEESCGRRPKEK